MAGRAVQVSIWYPASVRKSSPLTFNDYVYLEGREDSMVTGIQNDAAALKRFLEYPASSGADMNAWNSFLAEKRTMKANLNATLKPGDFPWVLLIHGSAVQYALMGEYLASHGMIAINVPYKGYLQNAFDVNVLGMETEMRDMEYSVDVVVEKLGRSPKGMAVVGISFGGQSAVGMAVRNPLIKAVVSLDGGIGSTFGPQLLNGHPFFNIEKVNMPILHLYNPADTGGNIDWFDVCEFADRYLVAFKHMDHSFFGIFGALDNSIPHVLGSSKSRAGDNGEAILLYTKTFLNGVFSNALNSEQIISLNKQTPWLPDCVESIAFKKKAFSPMPLGFWKETLEKGGLDGLNRSHDKYKQETGIPISDGSYRALFLEYFSKQDKSAILVIASLYESDFPQSALPKYYQGRARQLNDRLEEAKSYFTRCLELLTTDRTMSQAEKDAVRTRIEGFLR
jgi:dienelactone hydrolase